MQNMNLSDNHLVKITRSFGFGASLAALKILDMSRNKLKEISPEVYPNLPNLESLNLNYNVLSKVDRGLTRLPALSSLGIAGNYISSIPYFLLTIPKLKHVELEWDAIADSILQIPSSVIPQIMSPTLDLTKLRSKFKSFCLRYKVNLTPTTELSLYYHIEHSISSQLDMVSTMKGCLCAAKNSFPGTLLALLSRLGPCPPQEAIVSIIGAAIEGRPPNVLPKLVKKLEELPAECFGESANPVVLTLRMAAYDATLIRALASEQVDLLAKDRRGNTLLHCLMAETPMLQTSTLEALVLPWLCSKTPFPFNIRNNRGDTALLVAARGQLRQQIKTAAAFSRDLAVRGVPAFDWNAEDRDLNQTVLHLLCHEPSLLLLTEIQNLVSFDPIVVDASLRTPVCYIPKIFVTSRKLVLKWELQALFMKWTRASKPTRVAPLFKKTPEGWDSEAIEQPQITDGRSAPHPGTVIEKLDDPSSGRGNINILNSTLEKGLKSSSRRSLFLELPKPKSGLGNDPLTIGAKRALHLRPRSSSLLGRTQDSVESRDSSQSKPCLVLNTKKQIHPTYIEEPPTKPVFDPTMSGRRHAPIFKTQVAKQSLLTPTHGKDRFKDEFGSSQFSIQQQQQNPRDGIVLNQSLVNRFASLQKIGNSVFGMTSSQKTLKLVANKLSLRNCGKHARGTSLQQEPSDKEGFSNRTYELVKKKLDDLSQLVSEINGPKFIRELQALILQLGRVIFETMKLATIWQNLKHGATLRADSEEEAYINQRLVSIFPELGSLLARLVTRGRYEEVACMHQVIKVYLKSMQAFNRKSHSQFSNYVQNLLRTLKTESVWNTNSGFPLAKEFDMDREIRPLERQSRALVLSRTLAREGTVGLWEYLHLGNLRRTAPTKKILSIKISKSLQRPSVPLDWLSSQLAVQKANELSATSKSRGIASQISM